MRIFVLFLENICCILGVLFSLLFNRRVFIACIRHSKIAIYTGFIRNRFKSFGKYSRVQPKFCNLIGAEYIDIGENCSLNKNIELTAIDRFGQQHFSPSIKIGNNVQIGMNAKITAINSIVISNGVLTGRNLLITDNAHGESLREGLDIIPVRRPLISKGGVYIGENVWIGDNVTILPGVNIGYGCIIAANSVVTKNIPDYSVVGGIPAGILKTMV